MTPKLLFPQAPRKTRASTAAAAGKARPALEALGKKTLTQKVMQKKKQVSSGWSDDEDLFGGDDEGEEGVGEDIKPLKLVFGEAKGKVAGKVGGAKAKAGPAKTLAQELKNAGELAS